jgi:iron complex transport system substrate-binding protein
MHLFLSRCGRRIHSAALLLVVATSAAFGAERPFVDAAGRSIDVPANITRVAPAGPPADVLLYALAPNLLIGLVEPFEARQKPLVPAATRDLPKAPRLTAETKPADIEALRAAKPDVIVDYGDLSARYVAYADKITKATGIPYVMFDGRAAATPQALRAAAQFLGQSQRGEEAAGAAAEILAQLAPLAQLPAAQITPVYHGRGKDGLQAVRPGSTLDEAVVLAGGRTVTPAGKGAFATLTAEDVAKFAPRVVIVGDASAAAPESPLRKALPADTVFLVDPGVPFRWLEGPPSINRLLGALWLAAKLHPDHVSLQPETMRRLVNALFGLDLGAGDLASVLR